MAVTRVLWSGLTGNTGFAAMGQLSRVSDVKIIAGMKREVFNADDVILYGSTYDGVRWFTYDIGMFGVNGLIQLTRRANIDVIVDFSHPDVFEKVVELAVRTNVPLISGTSGLSNRQMATLYDATHRIPVFRGGNFRFKVKQFIDDAVEFAKRNKGSFDLYENFWQGKDLPSETSKVLQRRIFEATKREVIVHSSATFAPGNWINDWELQVHRHLSPTAMFQDKISCRVIGFDELAHDVLEIAKVMATKPIQKDEFYGLDEIWDDLPH